DFQRAQRGFYSGRTCEGDSLKVELVNFSGLRGVSEVTIVAVEVGSAKGRKSHFGIGNRALTVELDITVDHRVFPDGLSRAMALPRFHGFVVRPATAGDPGKKFQHQQIHRFRHDAPRILKCSISYFTQCNRTFVIKKESRGCDSARLSSPK